MTVEFNVKETSKGTVSVKVPDNASDKEILEAAREQVELGNACFQETNFFIDVTSKRTFK